MSSSEKAGFINTSYYYYYLHLQCVCLLSTNHHFILLQKLCLSLHSPRAALMSLLLEGGCCLVILPMLWVLWACLLSHFLEGHSGLYPLQDYLSVLPDLFSFKMFSLRAHHSGSASVNAQIWNTISTHTRTHSLTHSRTHTHTTPHSSHIHSLTHTHTHTHTHTYAYTLHIPSQVKDAPEDKCLNLVGVCLRVGQRQRWSPATPENHPSLHPKMLP